MATKKGSNECFGIFDGKKQDAFIHDEITDNDKARAELFKANVELAVSLGVKRSVAEKMYSA